MPRLLFVHAYALYTILKNTVLSSLFFLKVIYKVFPCCVPRLPPPQILFTISQTTFTHELVHVGGGGESREREREGEISYQSTSKWLVGHEKQCQETVLSFICNTHRRKKEGGESAWRMKLHYKLKLEGCFVFLSASVTLTGHLEYCCTMVYLPFLLQYNLLKFFSINKNRIPVLQTSGVIGVVPLFVCVLL